jgi:hypothetical protein
VSDFNPFRDLARYSLQRACFFTITTPGGIDIPMKRGLSPLLVTKAIVDAYQAERDAVWDKMMKGATWASVKPPS